MRLAPALLFGLLAAAPALAQVAPPPAATPAAGQQIVDQVVAVVGDTVLLHSDLVRDLQALEGQGVQIPSEPRALDAFVRQLLQQRVDELILLEAARDANVEVQDDQVNQEVEQRIQQAQRGFPSEAEFRAALAASGLTMEQYRQQLTTQMRDAFLVERFRQQRLDKAPRPNVSEDEMRRFFEAQKGSLGARPANVSFEQVVIEPQPSDSAKAAARRRIEEAYKELSAGADFEVLARRYSEDPGSREHGGDLGWFRRGRMVPAFENAVWAMRPGQVSGLVESPFGYHLIKLEKVRGAERQARHILIRPEITEADRERARQRADSIAAAVRAGAPLPPLAAPASAPLPDRLVEHGVLDRLPGGYGTELGSASAGQVVGPFQIETATGPAWVVARVTARQEAGEHTFEDLREQVRQRLQEQRMMEQLIDELRDGVYVRLLL